MNQTYEAMMRDSKKDEARIKRVNAVIIDYKKNHPNEEDKDILLEFGKYVNQKSAAPSASPNRGKSKAKSKTECEQKPRDKIN